MPYTERGITNQAREINSFLKADPLFEHGKNSRGIHIPDPRLITQPLDALEAEAVSAEGQVAVRTMKGLLEFAGTQNGLFVRTSDTGRVVDLEIRGMPEEIERPIAEEQITKSLLASRSWIRIIVSSETVYLKANSDVDYNQAGSVITQLVKAVPPQEQLFLIGRIVDITATAVHQASR